MEGHQVNLGDPNEMGTEEKVLVKLDTALSLSTETANGDFGLCYLEPSGTGSLPDATGPATSVLGKPMNVWPPCTTGQR